MPNGNNNQKKPFDPNIDYSRQLQLAQEAGASPDVVRQLIEARTQKALQTPGLGQYAFDPVYTRAQEYVRGGQQPQQPMQPMQQQTDIDRYLQLRERELTRGLEARAERERQALAEQQAGIAPRYAQARTQADVLGQQLSRRLAEQGITGGIATGDIGQAQLAQRVSTQQAISGLTQQEQSELDAIARQQAAIQANLAADIQTARAGLGAEALQARLAQEEAQRQFALQEAGLTGLYQGMPTLAGRQAELGIQGQQISNAISLAQLQNLPAQTQRELQLLDQQVRAGQISNEQAAIQLEELRNPQSITNQLRQQQFQLGAEDIAYRQRQTGLLGYRTPEQIEYERLRNIQLGQQLTQQPEVSVQEITSAIINSFNRYGYTPQQSYDELVNNAGEYIRDLGFTEYNRLLKLYEDQLPKEQQTTGLTEEEKALIGQ